MHHEIHAAKGALEAPVIAHVADEVTHVILLRKDLPHLVLLEFVRG